MEGECSGDLFHSNVRTVNTLSFILDAGERGRKRKRKHRNTLMREL